MYVHIFYYYVRTYIPTFIQKEQTIMMDYVWELLKNQILNHKWIKTAVSKRDSYEL